jgi:hypothetical protein
LTRSLILAIDAGRVFSDPESERKVKKKPNPLWRNAPYEMSFAIFAKKGERKKAFQKRCKKIISGFKVPS